MLENVNGLLNIRFGIFEYRQPNLVLKETTPSEESAMEKLIWWTDLSGREYCIIKLYRELKPEDLLNDNYCVLRANYTSKSQLKTPVVSTLKWLKANLTLTEIQNLLSGEDLKKTIKNKRGVSKLILKRRLRTSKKLMEIWQERGRNLK